jgi:gas vesicle protein
MLAWPAPGCAPAKPTPPQKTTAQNDSHDHDHDHGDHDHPETLAAGIAELETTINAVATKLASGKRDAADDALHVAGHLIEDLHGLLDGDQELSAEARAAGKKALDELFDCFDKLDTAMHAGADEAKESVADVHAAVKERIETALESLKDTFTTEAK